MIRSRWLLGVSAPPGASTFRDASSSRVMPCRLFPAERLGGLLDLLSDGTVSNQTAKSVLREMVLVRDPLES